MTRWFNGGPTASQTMAYMPNMTHKQDIKYKQLDIDNNPLKQSIIKPTILIISHTNMSSKVQPQLQ